MKAVIFRGIRDVELENNIPDPVIVEPRDAIVEVKYAGICGSDLHQFHGRERVRVGTILGHEFVGSIVETGTGVCGLSAGDIVMSPFTTCCGHCFYCRDGLSSRCEQWQLFGYQAPEDAPNTRGIQGAQAQFVRVPLAEATLLKKPDDLSYEEALLLGDNFTTGFYCADRAEIKEQGISVVIGCGAVGLSAIAAAKYFGAQTLIAVDGIENRRKRAESLGALAVTPLEAVQRVQEIAACHNRPGADSIMEAVGNPSAQRLAFELVRAGGVISSVGVHTASTWEFSPAEAYDKNVTYKSGRAPIRSYLNRLLSLVQDRAIRVPVDETLGVPRPISKAAEAYREFDEKRNDCVKNILDPSL